MGKYSPAEGVRKKGTESRNVEEGWGILSVRDHKMLYKPVAQTLI